MLSAKYLVPYWKDDEGDCHWHGWYAQILRVVPALPHELVGKPRRKREPGEPTHQSRRKRKLVCLEIALLRSTT